MRSFVGFFIFIQLVILLNIQMISIFALISYNKKILSIPLKFVQLKQVRPSFIGSRLRYLSNSNNNIIETTNIPKKYDYYNIDNDNNLSFGEYETIIAPVNVENNSLRKYVNPKLLGDFVNGPKEGDIVWIRGRVHSIRGKGNACFLILRYDSFNTIQTCHFKDKLNPDISKLLIKFINNDIPLESIVDIMGIVKSADVKSCSLTNVELNIIKVFIVSKSLNVLPFSIEDASRSQIDIDNSQTLEKPFPNVPQDTRLNNRWLDIRVPANNAIIKIRSGIMRLFRESLYNDGFIEISSPKLIPGESEGGSEVFRIDYFGQPACLAQSPQLYKQMAISADLNRVFEVGPVFRAENSNTRRHLCEFTGLDIEMAIESHYNEVLEVIHRMFRYIFTTLESKYQKELSIIRQQYPSEPITFTDEPLIIHWQDGLQLLRDNGIEVNDYDDLSSSIELKLGEIIKKKYSTDFFILDQYPSSIRPFYTMPNKLNPLYSNSYDIFIRGQEICSGAQRCHDVDMLINRIKEKGMDIESLKYYIESFRHGVYPHAGAGIGLERVVFLYLGLDNVRKASLFPRDPNRCEP